MVVMSYNTYMVNDTIRQLKKLHNRQRIGAKMTTQTIRRNSIKAIRAALAQCVLVTCYKYDDMDTNTDKGGVSVDDVIAAGESSGFDRVYKEVDASGELVKIVAGIHSNHFYTGYRTVEDVKRLLTDSAFAKYFPAEAAAERQAEEAAQELAYQAHRAELDAATATLATDAKQELFFVGQRIVATFATLNKNSSMGEYILECAKPENAEKFWNRTKWVHRKNWTVNTCRVERIVTMSAVDYDDFAANLMDHLPASLQGFEGGTHSDYDPGREVAELHQLTEDEHALWVAHSFDLVALVAAPGRQTIVINPHGYDYVRYAGLSPKSLHHQNSDNQNGLSSS